MNKSPEHTHPHSFLTYHMLMSENNTCISKYAAASSRPSVCLCCVCAHLYVCVRVCMCGHWDLAWQM